MFEEISRVKPSWSKVRVQKSTTNHQRHKIKPAQKFAADTTCKKTCVQHIFGEWLWELARIKQEISSIYTDLKSQQTQNDSQYISFVKQVPKERIRKWNLSDPTKETLGKSEHHEKTQGSNRWK